MVEFYFLHSNLPRLMRDDFNPRLMRDESNPRLKRDEPNPRFTRDDSNNPREVRDDPPNMMHFNFFFIEVKFISSFNPFPPRFYA